MLVKNAKFNIKFIYQSSKMYNTLLTILAVYYNFIITLSLFDDLNIRIV